MKDYDITVPANGITHVYAGGNYVKMLAPSAGTVEITAYETNQFKIESKIDFVKSRYKKYTREFEFLELKNNSGTAIEVTLLIGSGEVGDDTVSGAVTIDAHASANGGAQASIGTSSSQIAANSDRKLLVLHADNANTDTIWAAATAVNNGIPLSPGASFTLPVSGAVDFIAASGTQKLNYIEVE